MQLMNGGEKHCMACSSVEKTAEKLLKKANFLATERHWLHCTTRESDILGVVCKAVCRMTLASYHSLASLALFVSTALCLLCSILSVVDKAMQADPDRGIRGRGRPLQGL